MPWLPDVRQHGPVTGENISGMPYGGYPP